MMDPALNKTAAACIRQSCEGCEIQSQLLCIHTKKDLVDFGILFLMWLIPFLAGMIIGQFWWSLVIWFGLAAVFFIYIEALVLCRHCPHYAESGSTLKCHANAGLPKIPAYDPRPLQPWEKATWLFYVAILFLYFIPFFIISQQWLLLVITSWAALTAAWTVQRTQCTRCYHLSCPVNRVPEKVKIVFYQNYPDFAPKRERSG
jgi:hypothetical protein